MRIFLKIPLALFHLFNSGLLYFRMSYYDDNNSYYNGVRQHTNLEKNVSALQNGNPGVMALQRAEEKERGKEIPMPASTVCCSPLTSPASDPSCTAVPVRLLKEKLQDAEALLAERREQNQVTAPFFSVKQSPPTTDNKKIQSPQAPLKKIRNPTKKILRPHAKMSDPKGGWT